MGQTRLESWGREAEEYSAVQRGSDLVAAFPNSSVQTILGRRSVRVSQHICGEQRFSCAKPTGRDPLCGLELSVPLRRGVDVELSFWPLQIGGWLLYTIASATSNLPLRHEKGLIAFRTGFIVSAFLASFVMYPICRIMRLKKVSVLQSIAVCMTACAILGLGCSAAAVWSEIHFGGNSDPFRWSAALSGMTGGAFVLIAWCAIYSGIKQYLALEEDKARLRAAEASAREAQLLALRYQLQPHFLFNTLNAISSLVVGDRPQLATQMISRLGELLRTTLDQPDIHFVSLADEVIVVKEYLSIEEIRFAARLRVLFDISTETLACKVPRFILQPLVENAIRHGIAYLPAGGTVILRATIEDERLTLQVENDVQAMHTPAANCPGLGLANTRQRISQIYGPEASVSVREEVGAFTVSLTLPCGAAREANGTLS